MRRSRIQHWETEARDAAEALRASLASLAALEQHMMAETPPVENVARVLNAALEETERLSQWLPGWQSRAVGAQGRARVPAYLAFEACLSPLVYTVDVYSWALSLAMLGGGSRTQAVLDGELAREAVDRCKTVATFALGIIEDTPALRRRHLLDLQVALDGFRVQAAPLLTVGPRLHDRLGARRKELGIHT